MSALGLYERYETDLEVREAGKHWREDAFLHQLSHNGSMMLAVNHDQLWRECLASTLGQSQSMSWEWLCGLLRIMPESAARQRLWRASYLWWMHTQRLRLRVLASGLEAGILPYLADSAPMRDLARQLLLRGRQLEELAWCQQEVASADEGTITVVDAPAPAPAPRKRARK